MVDGKCGEPKSISSDDRLGKRPTSLRENSAYLAGVTVGKEVAVDFLELLHG